MSHVLHRLWVERLNQEYEQICYQYRVKLSRPHIIVEALNGKWGEWDGLTRTIAISESLIREYPWEAVLEILKHEMAHQYSQDVLRVDDGHGPVFRESCQKLAVASWAARAQTQMVPRVRPENGNSDLQTERLLQKVEKLLSLATSSNEHEALLAMQKVQELYGKYHLDRVQGNRPGEWVYLTLGLGRKKTARYQTSIASLLNDHFMVRVIHTSRFNAALGEEEKALELLGTTENVLMAEYVFGFLSSQLGKLWELYRKEKQKKGKGTKNSYYLGVLAGFREKLENSREAQREKWGQESGKTKTQVLSLVRSGEQQLESYLRHRYPRLVTVRHGGRLSDSGSFNAGKAAGKEIVLHRGLSRSEGFLGRFLPTR